MAAANCLKLDRIADRIPRPRAGLCRRQLEASLQRPEWGMSSYVQPECGWWWWVVGRGWAGVVEEFRKDQQLQSNFYSSSSSNNDRESPTDVIFICALRTRMLFLEVFLFGLPLYDAPPSSSSRWQARGPKIYPCCRLRSRQLVAFTPPVNWNHDRTGG